MSSTMFVKLPLIPPAGLLLKCRSASYNRSTATVLQKAQNWRDNVFHTYIGTEDLGKYTCLSLKYLYVNFQRSKMFFSDWRKIRSPVEVFNKCYKEDLSRISHDLDNTANITLHKMKNCFFFSICDSGSIVLDCYASYHNEKRPLRAFYALFISSKTSIVEMFRKSLSNCCA